MAVAVHPEDARYAALVGKHVRLPITGRLIPIIADEHADPELGSGAVKITPGHDFNDFEVGKRAGFKPAEMLNMLDRRREGGADRRRPDPGRTARPRPLRGAQARGRDDRGGGLRSRRSRTASSRRPSATAPAW